VKTKSLTPWCNLYYSELKYNIKVSPSTHWAISILLFYGCFTYLTLSVFIGFQFWLGLGIVTFLIFSACYYLQASTPKKIKCLALFISTENKTRDHFTLSDTGECQFSDKQPIQLAANSQINLWGYWLVFVSNDVKLKQYFIFKDSLSEQDQARLARTITRVKMSLT